MTWDFALGVLVGVMSSAAFGAGYGYHKLRLVVADRSASKPAPAVPDPAPVTT